MLVKNNAVTGSTRWSVKDESVERILPTQKLTAVLQT